MIILIVILKYSSSDNAHRITKCGPYDVMGSCSFCEAFVPLSTGEPHRWEFHGPDGTVVMFTTSVHRIGWLADDLEMDIDISDKEKGGGGAQGGERTAGGEGGRAHQGI